MEGGNALAKLISGQENPSGHLPFTIAKSEDDYPPFLFPGDRTDTIEYGYYHGYTLLEKEGKEPAYPFGFGLSFTQFAYQRVSVKPSDDGVTVSLTVKNTGERDGKTVIRSMRVRRARELTSCSKDSGRSLSPRGRASKCQCQLTKTI